MMTSYWYQSDPGECEERGGGFIHNWIVKYYNSKFKIVNEAHFQSIFLIPGQFYV